MKRTIILLLTLALLLSFTACGANTTETDRGELHETGTASEESSSVPVPAGLYMLKYIGDETGSYVEEFNVFEDFFGEPITIQEMLWADNSTIWCQIGEDGVGTFYSGNYAPVGMDFNVDEPGMLLFGGARHLDESTGEYVAEEALVPYHYDADTGEFRLEEQPGFWDVMAPCSQAALDLVFEGKGGSVPLSEAEIGDIVCLGEYMQTLNADKNEAIRWRVLDRDGDKLLLLSEKLLDSFSYNYNPEREILTDVTWENCSLREFLNLPEGFLSMFTEEEIARMQTTRLENKAANEELMAQWGGFEDQGEKKYSDLAIQDRPDDPDTEDRIFLLSYQEVLRYFGEPTEAPELSVDIANMDYPFTVMKVNPDWIAYVTDAVTAGYYDNVTRGGAWMTRTLCNSHTDEDMVVYISSTGQVFDYYTYVPLFIRPAVWVSAAD